MLSKCEPFHSHPAPPCSTLSTRETAIMYSLNLLFSQGKHLAFPFHLLFIGQNLSTHSVFAVVLSLTISLFISVIELYLSTQVKRMPQDKVAFVSSLSTVSHIPEKSHLLVSFTVLLIYMKSAEFYACSPMY